MNPETKTKIGLLKEKGLTTRQIKEVLNLTNHDLYDKPKKEANPEPPKNTEGNRHVKVSKNDIVNTLLTEQEECLRKLKSHIDTPFKDKWEYAEWHREAIALQLGQFNHNELTLDNKALWGWLLESEKPVKREMRDWVIYILHNHLEITFAQARQELAQRENADEPR